MEYEGQFNSNNYLALYYVSINGSEDEKFEDYFLKQLSEVFNKDFITGDWLLDVGTGPCLHTAIISSRKFKNIVLSDYTTSNRDEIIKWMKKEESAHSWECFLNYFAKKEGIDEIEIEKRTRNSIKAVFPIDVNKPKPLEPIWFQKFDCLLSSLCLEAASADVNAFHQCIRNLKTLLNSNGHVILIGVLGETFYIVDGIRWPVCSLAIDDIREAFLSNNFKIIHEDTINLVRDENLSSDASGLFCVVAQLI